ncbi:MAG: 4-alpha-glucanotransferase [Parvibaculaceae bacterium]
MSKPPEGDLDRLATLYGIAPAYVSETDKHVVVGDDAKRGVLAAMGVSADDAASVARALAGAPVPDVIADAPLPRCFVPDWLLRNPAWGLSCQLYGLRSPRNAGIGDFEDLARLCEIAGDAGADFLAVNPLHALFLADPERVSPYSPSHRQFLNPLYIALDRLEEIEEIPAQGTQDESELVDYAAVARFKGPRLREAFARFVQRRHDGDAARAFARFRAERGEALSDFVLFETLSAHFAGAGWTAWPEEYRSRRSAAVARFAAENTEVLAFHAWLQWVADRQLKDAQARACAAGMRIGLLVDLAVGVARDGAATWADPSLTTPGARIGAPPDLFNDFGQDWDLAPISPARLRSEASGHFGALVGDVMRPAGAIRIDHVMALRRLWWIPEHRPASGGAYVRYPFESLVGALAEQSQRHRAVVVGEDLGTVPEGFRETIARADILSCRVVWFERRADGGFIHAADYPARAFTCLSTHDLPTLQGWWSGADIALRLALGLLSPETAEQRRSERMQEKRRLAEAVGVDPDAQADKTTANPDLVLAAHRFLAETPSWLAGVRLEDALGVIEQTNMPGTVDEHPNWRRRMPLPIAALQEHAMFRAISATMREKRARMAGTREGGHTFGA